MADVGLRLRLVLPSSLWITLVGGVMEYGRDRCVRRRFDAGVDPIMVSATLM